MKASSAKADRARKSTGVKAVKKLQRREPTNKLDAPKPEVEPNPVKTGIDKATTNAILVALKPMQAEVRSLRETIQEANNKIKILNARVDDLQNQPMRVKVHRDGNKLIDYFDRIPVEVTKLNS